MVSEEIIKKNLNNTLGETDFKLGKKYAGKVRDNYIIDDKRIIITTDRISAFDRVLTTLPFKGQVLNEMAVFWFNETRKIAPNALIDAPDPNVMIVKECEIMPIEMVVRGYITGSAWRDYQAGKEISGIMQGLKKDQKFDMPIITPTTKAQTGHDQGISKKEITSKKIISKDIYEEMEESALKLFDLGTKHCSKQGLILVDTKYEFGLFNDELFVVDEMHTPDSSRFWFKNSYNNLFSEGKEQRMLDKEYVRKWLISKDFMGDGPIPVIPKQVKIEAIKKYINAFELITGQEFVKYEGKVLERIKNNLIARGYI